MPPEVSAGACPCTGPVATEMSHIAVATATAPARARSNSADHKCSLRLSPLNAWRANAAIGAGLHRMLVLLQPKCKRAIDAFRPSC